MTRTFLVALNLTDASDLAGHASDIQEDLLSTGHDVESVKPWGGPGDILGSKPVASAIGLSLSPVEPAPTQNLET